MNTISFPGLGLNFTINRIAFTIGSWTVSWYGIIIAVGLLLALIYGMRRSKFFGVSADDLADVVIFGIIFAIIGARLYYVIFYPGTNTYFSDPITILYIWNGGLGIYGGIIAAFAAAFVVCKHKKISSGAVFDIAALGFLIGQAIGRWGNFVNQEAYGSATNLPWRMKIYDTSLMQYVTVHPCFLYESLWCILGFVLLHIYSKRRKFNGEVFLMYIGWYSFGRFFIEGLRSDSLMLGNFKISQLVAAIFFLASAGIIIYKRNKLKKALEQQNNTYEPLFEETSKAINEDKALEKLENGEEHSENNESTETDETLESAENTGNSGKSENSSDGTDTSEKNISGEDKDINGDDADKTED